MPIDTTALQATIDALVVQVEKTKGVEASAKAMILGQGTAIVEAVTKAIQENDAISNSAIAPLTQVINDVTAKFAASADDLGAAIPANPLPTP